MTLRGRRRQALRSLAAAGAVVLATACGNTAKTAAGIGKIGRLPNELIPETVLGLRVSVENDKLASEINHERRSYVQAVGLYSFRRGDLLQATLQVSRFTKTAPARRSKFRQAIIDQVAQAGRSEAQSFRMAGHVVYLSPGPQQNLSLWFGSRSLFVLTVRREFPEPRALMRELVTVEV